jgi:antitoxin component HigA of HigAB toxin-antitoxin module
MTTTTKASVRPPADYLDLILHVHPLRPIRSNAEHQQAKRALRSLAGDRRKVAADFKKVLVGIIETYEREAGMQLDVSAVSAADIVHHLLDERNMSANALAKSAGLSQCALSDMLNGKRQWSKSAIIRLADFFGLNRGVFLR